MRWLIFLSRAAFLCGLVMLVALSLLFTSWTDDNGIASSAVMAGYGLATVLLPLTGLIYLWLLITRKKLVQWVPKWLIIANLLMLFIFLIFTFYFNDPYYHQR